MIPLRKVKIKDMGKVYTGSTPSTKDETMWGDEHLFVKPSDMISGNRRVFETQTTLSNIATKTAKGRLLPAGTTCVVCIGTIGKLCQLHEPAATNQQVNSIVVDRSKFDPDYVYYLMSQSIPHVKVVEGGSASGREHVKKSTFEEIELDVIAFDAQQKVGELVVNYDNLIENNNRRIAILEDMAQSLYQEWFVKFRFPGHENCQFKDSPLGQIPRGWEVKPISDEINILGGGTPKKSVPEYWEEGDADISWFTPSDLTKQSSMYIEESGLQITELGLKKSSAKLFPAYSVMMTSRATIGVISINTTPACTNQGFIICVPNERVSTEYIRYWLMFNMQVIDNLATGATFREVRRTLFKELPFLIPTEKVFNIFNYHIKPITSEIEILIKKNKNLRSQRDILLPKLISGKITI